MAVVRMSVRGDPNVGAWITASEDHALVPPLLSRDDIETVEETLDVTVIVTTVAGSNLVGTMVAMNSNGALLPRNAEPEEIKALEREGIDVDTLPSKMNAVGNIVLTNDRGAIVHPELDTYAVETVEDVLGVKAEPMDVGGVKIPGSAGVATEKGALVHPAATQDELEKIERVLGVPADVGTVNKGSPFIGSGLVANSDGALVGEETTGPELARIEDVLELI